MKKFHVIFFFFWMILPALAPTSLLCQTTETNKQIASALSAGNATELASYFNTMVDLTIPGKEDSYGKTQATRILQDFFSKNPVKSYKTNKQGSSNDGSQFAIGRLESGNKIFRVYYLMKKSSDKYLIHQFQIQEEN
jgi:hypothetical protein